MNITNNKGRDSARMATHNAVQELKAPNERLKYIRELLKLTRAYMHEKHGISQDSLAAWENGKARVTDSCVDRCIKAYRAEGLIVSKEWILAGEGLDPKFSLDLSRYFRAQPTEKPEGDIDDEILKLKELEYFKSLTPNSVVSVISSDDMLPLYASGDYVGGRFKFGGEIDDCIGKDCIIKTVEGSTFVRRIAKNISGDGYNLAVLNPQYDGTSEPVIFNAKIESAAPIIWHRRSN